MNTPTLNPVLPTLSGDNTTKLRAIMRYLSQYGMVDTVVQETLARLAQVRDENGEQVFTDTSPTAPENVLARQTAHIGALAQFYASNIPLLIEDYLLALSGEQPAPGTPEFAWVVHRLTAPRQTPYTIPAGRELTSESGAAYVSVTAVTIPAGAFGDEVGTDGRLLYEQLFQARVSGVAQRVAPFTLTKPTASIAYVESSVNRRASFGGRDPETFEEFRVRVHQTPLDKLLVTPEDFARAAIQFLGPRARAVVVGRVSVSGVKVPNLIQIAAIDPGGNLVTPEAGGLALIEHLAARTVDPELILTAPVFTAIQLGLEVVLESGSRLDDADVEALVRAELATSTAPLNWADWGEEENQFSGVRLAGALAGQLTGVDRIKITALRYVTPSGGVVPVDNGAEVTLTPVIGLPQVTLTSLTVTREHS